jgi:hypothetical protein
MADAAEVSFVLDAIDPHYEDYGWEETDIVDRIDNGAIPARVVAAYWRMRASRAITLVNTSEAGSSRGNDAIYARMKALADEWDTKALALENPVVVVAETGRLSSFPIRRV